MTLYFHFGGHITKISFEENVALITSSIDFYYKNRVEFPKEGLKILKIAGNRLIKIKNLPEGLEALDCSSNKLNTLPRLPKSLKRLYCHKNLLTSLEGLPEGLEILSCGDNRLEILKVQSPELTYLGVNDNLLTTIKISSKKLQTFRCKRNNFQECEISLTNLNLLDCDFNFSKFIQGNAKILKNFPTKNCCVCNSWFSFENIRIYLWRTEHCLCTYETKQRTKTITMLALSNVMFDIVDFLDELLAKPKKRVRPAAAKKARKAD